MSDIGNRMDHHSETMKEDISTTTEHAKQAAGEMAGKVREKGREYTQRAKEYGQQSYEYAADKTKEARHQAEDYIHENPWYAVGIAVGVGVLVGLMLRGSHHD